VGVRILESGVKPPHSKLGCGGDAAEEVVLFWDGFGADGEGVQEI